jgi:hypothetical protein
VAALSRIVEMFILMELAVGFENPPYTIKFSSARAFIVKI